MSRQMKPRAHTQHSGVLKQIYNTNVFLIIIPKYSPQVIKKWVTFINSYSLDVFYLWDSDNPSIPSSTLRVSRICFLQTCCIWLSVLRRRGSLTPRVAPHPLPLVTVRTLRPLAHVRARPCCGAIVQCGSERSEGLSWFLSSSLLFSSSSPLPSGSSGTPRRCAAPEDWGGEVA